MENTMRQFLKPLLVFTVLLPLFPGLDRASAQNTNTAPKTPVRVKFRPQANGAPSVRLTGGSRGIGEAAGVSLDVLAPEEVGLTTLEQPSLFWFQSKPANAKLELSVLRKNEVEPICEVVFEHADKAGIQRLNLADHAARLRVGVEYQWVVALVSDPENRSSDVVATGRIKRIEPPSDLKRQIAQATPDSLSSVYAQAGIWYDALTVLSDQIEAQPHDRELRQTRSDLLAQVRLNAAAASDARVKKD
jgi:hypothetical protein